MKTDSLEIVSPRFLIKQYRQKAKFKCNSDTAPIWTLNGQKLPRDIKLYRNDSILVIYSFKATHIGSYYCWGYNSAHQQNVIDCASLALQGMNYKKIEELYTIMQC